MTSERIGWILIHAGTQFEEGEYKTPESQLKGEYKPEMLWHWNRGLPLKEGEGFKLLFSWKNEIFGEADADITHEVDWPDEYNFAFRLRNYREIKKKVRLADLPVPRKPRDLIKLTPNILTAYNKAKRGK